MNVPARPSLSHFLFRTRGGNILVSLLFFMFLCVLVEIGSRVVLNLYMPDRGADKIAKLTYEPYLVWVQDNKLDLHRKVVHGEIPPKDEDTYRIVVIGGSTSAQMPSEALIEAFSPYIDKNIEVLNLGQGGYLANQALIMLALYGIPLDPDLIIGIDGANDIGDFSKKMRPGVTYNARYVERAVESPWTNALFSALNNSQFVLGMIKLGERTQEREMQHEAGQFEKMERNFVTSVSTISALANGKGIKHIAVLQPYLFLRSSITDREQGLMQRYRYRREFFVKAFLSMKEALEREPFQEGTTLVTALDAFDDSSEEIFTDWVHLTPTGNRLFADYIARQAAVGGAL